MATGPNCGRTVAAGKIDGEFSSVLALPLPLAGEGWGGGATAIQTARVERAPTRIASHDAMRPPPQAGEVETNQPSLRPISRNFCRRCLRLASASRLLSSVKAWAMASPV